MLHELREFCEDNNAAPPGALREVPARPELTFWQPSDPVLEIEAEPAVAISIGERTVYLQRVIYDLRYSLFENGEERERGDVPGGNPADEARLHVAMAKLLEIARAWLGGADFYGLPRGRRPFV